MSMLKFLKLLGRALLIGVLLIAIPGAGRAIWAVNQPTPTGVAATTLADRDGVFLNFNGAQVYVVTAGRVGDPVVVLVHGLLGSTREFDTLLPALTAAGFRAVAFDRPPFGLSDKSATQVFSLDAQAAMVWQVLDQLGIDKAILAGHSAGGPVVVRAAQAQPNRTRGLVLMAPAIGAANTSSNPAAPFILSILAQGANPIPPWAEAELRQQFSDDALLTFLAGNRSAPPAVFDARTRDGLTRFTRITGWEAGFRAYGQSILRETNAFTIDELNSVTTPSLIMWCTDDRLIPYDNSAAVVAALRQNELITLSACGHQPWNEQRAAFLTALGTFAQRLPAAP
jgi:pimeloyl-ACP methyl ester carboxylesterase